GGGLFLQDLMTVADDFSRSTPPANSGLQLLQPELAVMETENSFRYGKRAILWGMVWLCAMYVAYLLLFRRQNMGFMPLVAAMIFSRWIMAWLIFGFPAAQPGWLHKGFTKRDFVFCSGLTLLILLPMSSLSLFMSLLTGMLGVYIFIGQRRNITRELDEFCYGVGVAWSELLFLLGWLLFGSIIV
ncbi:MAG: hypothetical protein RR051_04165, partial [Clostridiales bacterium]